MPRRATPQNAFSGIAELRQFLLENIADKTWRNMADKEFHNLVSAGTLNRIARDKDYEPKRPDIRRALGLPCFAPAPVCPKCGVVHTTKRCTANRKPRPRAYRYVNYPVVYLRDLAALAAAQPEARVVVLGVGAEFESVRVGWRR